MKSPVIAIVLFLKDRFNLSGDRANEGEIVAEIRRGVEFKGVNVWVLVFAIMVASIGLNVNSTAVIIGAMLISPLMGPIMGIGLGVGISDMELLKKGGKNLAVMVAVSVATSALYFSLSPLQEAQSELLARTTPTIWDVFIALFGGLAGIVATASRERGNVIPGVAIATALMPPLCTAGYGLATGQWRYFAGAFYLFSINAVFICFSTLLIVRFLRFHEVSFVSQEMKKRVRTIVAILVLLTVIPSIYIARNLVLKTIFQQRVSQYVNSVFDFPATQVFRYEYRFGKEKEIEVTLMGSVLDENTLANLRNQLKNYQLYDVNLIVRQGERKLDAETLKSQVMEEFLARSLDSLQSKDEKIAFLHQKLLEQGLYQIPVKKLSEEAIALDNRIQHFSVQEAIIFNQEKKTLDTIHLAYVNYSSRPKSSDLKRFSDWLKVRIEADSLKVVVE